MLQNTLQWINVRLKKEDRYKAMSTTDMHDDNIELKAVILCGTFHVSP
jgi:hypothetical protein